MKVTLPVSSIEERLTELVHQYKNNLHNLTLEDLEREAYTTENALANEIYNRWEKKYEAYISSHGNKKT